MPNSRTKRAERRLRERKKDIARLYIARIYYKRYYVAFEQGGIRPGYPGIHIYRSRF